MVYGSFEEIIMKQKQRIIFIISSSIAGGGQVYLFNILSCLAESFSALLICPNGYLPDKVQAELTIDVVRMDIGIRSLGQLKAIIKHEIKANGRVYVNAHLLGTGLWSHLALKGLKNNHLTVTLHNGVIYPGMAWYKRLVYPAVLRFISKSECNFIAVSQEISNSVKSYTGKECTYIPSSVPIKEPPVDVCEDITKKEIINIGFVGRLSHLKNPVRFLEMAHLVKKEVPQSKYVIIGDGELRDQVEECIKKYHLVGSVDMKGFISKPGPEMRELDVLVISSNSEGTPLVLLEAMSYGIPVVSTKVGAIPVVINDGVDGVLCDCSSESLAEGVLKLINNREFYKEVARQAFSTIKDKFSYDNNISKYMGVVLNGEKYA